jgi:spore coat polysaccharide biosynthesis protein SpsF (cytidylyltransferase family)
MRSSRLPGKHLLPLWQDIPAITCLIRRLQRTGARIILCIPDGADESPLQKIADEEGIDTFSGDPENVLRRYQQCLSNVGLSSGVIVDADDVLVSVSTVSQMRKMPQNAEYIRAEGFPYGGAPSRLGLDLLERMLSDNASPNGWSLGAPGFARSAEKIVCEDLPAGAADLRLSLDYQEDYDFLRELFTRFDRPEDVSLRTAVDIVLQNKNDFATRFPGLFDGTLATRADDHLRREIRNRES